MEKKNKEIENVKKKVFKENALSLRISRVPPDTKKEFMELANSEFCGDYGMTLKWLIMDRWNKLVEFETRLASLESKVTGKPVKVITTMSGKKIEVKKSE